MRIIEIRLNNFKAFAGEHVIQTNSSVVCFVGENNTGKTSVFAAIDFLKNGVPKEKTIEDFKNKGVPDEPVSVEITIEGNLRSAIAAFSEDKYLPYVYEVDAKQRIRVRRSSEKLTVTQKGKSVELDEKKLPLFNPETNQFENVAGFDKAVGTLFETQFIWSDLKPDDVVDFGTTKTLGRLLKEVATGFQDSPDWKSFMAAHNKAFETGDDALLKRSEQMRGEIQSALGNFYGKADVEFAFQPPDPASFIKLGEIRVDDGVNTSIAEKGSGMQRALALAVTKVYADFLAKHEDDAALTKPLFFFIDEPEISLHPKAQAVLVDALCEIAKRQQVFMTTHSPLFLKCLGINENTILVFSRKAGVIKTAPAAEAATFSFSPTLAEINYLAYGLATEDFHNELYGHITEVSGKFTATAFDEWVVQNSTVVRDKNWIRIKGGVPQAPESVTLMTYIRHSIHHPENTTNSKYTSPELASSIQAMLSIIKSGVFVTLKGATT